MINLIILHGRLTRDPELRRTASGVSVASVTLAVDRDFTEANGTRQTDFIDLVAWRQTAERLCKFFSKGREAAVTGRLQMRTWTDKEGQKRISAEVVVDRIDFCGPKDAPRQIDAAPAPAPSDFAMLEDEDGELPF